MDDAWKRKFARKFGRWLAAARQLRGISREELEALADVAASQLEQYGAGIGRIPVDELERIAAALRLPVTHFLETCALCGSE